MHRAPSRAAALAPLVHAEVGRVAGRIVAARRSLHAYPELAFKEFRTAKMAARWCSKLGYDVREGIAGTGLVAELDSGRPGPTVLVRADMDALPIEEATAVSYRSKVPGVMHACGHDGHVAVTLGVAQVFAQLHGQWAGRLRLCFQPAEETDEGAAQMIAEGVADGIDAATALHLQAGLQTGTVAIGSGVQWAASDQLRLVVRGQGGHAMDHLEIADPIGAAADIILTLRSVSRHMAPDSGAMVSIGQVQAGTAPNVVPSTAQLFGTVRTLRRDNRDRVLDQVAQAARDAAERHGASVDVRFEAHCPAVVCDPDATAAVRHAVSESPSVRDVVEAQPSSASDDMARFLQLAPGCYFRVGISDLHAEPATPHHHPAFDIDERALPIAAEALTLAALGLLSDI